MNWTLISAGVDITLGRLGWESSLFEDTISVRSTQWFGTSIQASAVINVWETDSPFLVRRRRDALQHDVNATNNNANIPTQKDQIEVNTTASSRRLAFTPTPNLGQVTNWKTNKQDQLLNIHQCFKDCRYWRSKRGISENYNSMLLNWPPQVGKYRTICGNCHVRGHQADGKNSCKAPPCILHTSDVDKEKSIPDISTKSEKLRNNFSV